MPLPDADFKDAAVMGHDNTSTKSHVEAGAVPAGELFIEPKDERRVLAKLDIFITPILFIVYLSCFIDRANIG